ncbi:hypothetical protein MTO96_023829 [Rhipicephalus appendiculatus]
MASYVMDLVELLKSHADPPHKGLPIDRQPDDGADPYHRLPHVIMAYNACMVMLNTFFFYKFLSHSYLGGGYSWICQGIDFQDPGSITIVSYCWWYFMVRIVDFADTLFFLLRKKYSHISFLHVVHHSLVVWNGWLFITFGADGQGIMGVSINSFIHIVMYSYYFLSALGPSVQKYLWWKKYITTMQIVQFAVFIAFVCVPLFKDCGYPRFLTYLAAPPSQATVPLKEGEKGTTNGTTVVENGNGHVNGYLNGVGLKKREVKTRTH